MPRAKRQNAGDGEQSDKQQKCDQASGPAPNTGSVVQRKANTRSTSAKKDNAGAGQITKPSPLPKLQLTHIPPLTKPDGFPCFSDGDVLIADENIPKKMLGPNPTELAFCLELNDDLESVSLPKSNPGQLQCGFTDSETNETHRPRWSYDGITEAAPTSPIDRGPIISPPRTPVPDIKEDDAPPRSPTYNSPIPVRATEASSLKTVLECISRAQPIPASIVLATGMQQTDTSGSESRSADMRQYTVPEKRSYGPFIVKEHVPNEGVSESRVCLRAAELDNETPITRISASEPFATTESKETGTTTIHSANTSNFETPEKDYTETPIRLLKLDGVNPAAKTGDMVDKTSSAVVNTEPTSAKETQGDDECQFISARSRRPSPPAVTIMPKSQYRLTHHRKIETLLSLFRVAYHKVPIISHTDMELALFQTENLIAAAKFYRALEAVVAPIGCALAQSGRSLYQSIALEPVRWLNVAMELEHEMIFQEGVIHLVAKFSDADNFNPELFSGVPDNVIDLVYRKVVDRDRKLCEVHGLLISSSIYESEMRVKLEEKYSFETSIVVHAWREWYLHRHSKARIQNARPNKPNVQSKLGILYRKILTGGDGYLPEGKVLDTLRSFQLSRLQDGANQNALPLR
ncbi:hypothetical protein VE02_01432 [Pseudogymnoascus sp. 03VT05]|nr:hypothetical protein VE02_01432 [Pseudogymnoascus sp. 03VT05]